MSDLIAVITERATTCNAEAWRAIIHRELPQWSEGQISELIASFDKKIQSLEAEAHEQLLNGVSYREKTELAREFRAKRRDLFSWYHETHPRP